MPGTGCNGIVMCMVSLTFLPVGIENTQTAPITATNSNPAPPCHHFITFTGPYRRIPSNKQGCYAGFWDCRPAAWRGSVHIMNLRYRDFFRQGLKSGCQTQGQHKKATLPGLLPVYKIRNPGNTRRAVAILQHSGPINKEHSLVQRFDNNTENAATGFSCATGPWEPVEHICAVPMAGSISFLINNLSSSCVAQIQIIPRLLTVSTTPLRSISSNNRANRL